MIFFANYKNNQLILGFQENDGKYEMMCHKVYGLILKTKKKMMSLAIFKHLKNT